MFLELIAAVALAIVGVAIIFIALLTLEAVRSWFLGYEYVVLSDADNIAFTLKENLRTGNYKVVQGVFNKRTSVVREKRVMEAKDLDSNLKAMHQEKELVVYETEE